MWNEILIGLFPIGLIFAIVIGYLAEKNNWKITKYI